MICSAANELILQIGHGAVATKLFFFIFLWL